MGTDSRFTEEDWNGWLTPFQTVQILERTGVGDREQSVNWLKARLRSGEVKAGGWFHKFDDELNHTSSCVAIYKVKTWEYIHLLDWKDDFWISGSYTPEDLFDTSFDTMRKPKFSHWIERARFQPRPIEEFCRQADHAASREPKAPPAKSAGGRPPKPFWDQLWPFIAGQLYVGDLKPERQADIEKAMSDWILANGHDAGESTVRRAARALWQAISREDQN